MAQGRIRSEDIAEVREKARIDEVVSDYVTLRNAGSGALKGLCPFHDEKSPSFHVTPSRNLYHCFGCQAGGDVISFVMEIDGLTFTDTVEQLAGKYGVTLRYEEGGPTPEQRREASMRPRLLEAHKLAAEFYAEQLASPDALPARQFLAGRDFNRDDAEHFGVGFAPTGGRDLVAHLRAKGFDDDELITGNLANRGRYDRFQGRLMWPIRDTSGSTIGFGARKLFDDDRIEAKYLNTSETPVYKKSQVLYGLDLARREMARTRQAVVVEGYTDVMACHLAGITTAVATCGTAFGEEHGRVLRRLLLDHEDNRGEVIFTFDGDEAGQRAALKAFAGDQQFASQTYVAVEPSGMDPCDLRQAQGDAAVRELVARREPLYRFVLGNVLRRFDLDRADGRIDAVREAARLVASVRDRSKVTAFAQEISRLVGADVETNQVLDEVRRAQRRDDAGESAPAPGAPRTPPRTGGQDSGPATEAPPVQAWPDPHLQRFALEREMLRLVLQAPAVAAEHTVELDAADFTHPLHAMVWQAVASLGGPAAAGATEWVHQVRARTTEQVVSGEVAALAVEPLKLRGEPTGRYAARHALGLQELTTVRRITDLKSRLQRTNPVTQQADYNRMFGELVALEQARRALREQVVGEA
ncbi:DNA primase [Nocardioidaceae bacterium]|nr:DNA primase [Nocardioidaceae bacterium]